MRRLLALAALAGLAACRLPNPDHCVHKSVDGDAWCAAEVPERPFCSPCASERHGCVAERPDPDQCPAYDEGTSSGSGSAGSSSATG